MKPILHPSYTGTRITPPPTLPQKRPQNTAAGCRDRAAADLLEASTLVAANERRRFERSAESWSQRADLLGRVETSFKKRAALDEASRQYERVPVRP